MEKFPSPENIENQIEQLLKELDNYALDQFPEEIQDELADEWYFAEEQAKNGKRENREQALEDLRAFIDKLSKTPKKEE